LALWRLSRTGFPHLDTGALLDRLDDLGDVLVPTQFIARELE
jgi:hypothetical protein